MGKSLLCVLALANTGEKLRIGLSKYAVVRTTVFRGSIALCLCCTRSPYIQYDSFVRLSREQFLSRKTPRNSNCANQMDCKASSLRILHIFGVKITRKYAALRYLSGFVPRHTCLGWGDSNPYCPEGASVTRR